MPIPGAKNRRQAEENAGALGWAPHRRRGRRARRRRPRTGSAASRAPLAARVGSARSAGRAGPRDRGGAPARHARLRAPCRGRRPHHPHDRRPHGHRVARPVLHHGRRAGDGGPADRVGRARAGGQPRAAVVRRRRPRRRPAAAGGLRDLRRRAAGVVPRHPRRAAAATARSSCAPRTRPARSTCASARRPRGGRGRRHAERPDRRARSPARRSATTAASASSASASAATPSTRPVASSSSGTRRARSPPASPDPSPTRCSARTGRARRRSARRATSRCRGWCPAAGYGFLLDSTWLNRFDLTAQRALAGGDGRARAALARLRGPRARRRAPPGHRPTRWSAGSRPRPSGSSGPGTSRPATTPSATRSAPGGARPWPKGGLDVPDHRGPDLHALPAVRARRRADDPTRQQRATTDAYHSWGYRVTTYVNSFVCQDHPDGAYAEGEANGWFVKTPLGTTYPLPYLAYLDSPSALVDFTAPGAAACWRSIVSRGARRRLRRLDGGLRRVRRPRGGRWPTGAPASPATTTTAPTTTGRATSSPGRARARTSPSSCAAATRAPARWPASCGAATPPRTTPRPTAWRRP